MIAVACCRLRNALLLLLLGVAAVAIGSASLGVVALKVL